MILHRLNDLETHFCSGFSTMCGFPKSMNVTVSFEGGDEYLFCNPATTGISRYRYFFDSFQYKPVGHMSYLIGMYEQNQYSAGVSEQGIPFESLSYADSFCLFDFFGNSGWFNRTVSFYYIHVEFNEPTPTPNIPIRDMTIHPFIQSPAFQYTVLFSRKIHIYVLPGCMSIPFMDAGILLITESSCDVSTNREAPNFNGASQDFCDSWKNICFHSFNTIENKEGKNE